MSETLKKLTKRIKQFGGLRLVWDYLRIGVGKEAITQILNVVIGRTNPDQAYAIIRREVATKLQIKYYAISRKLKENYETMPLLQELSDKIWFCWLQGMDNAPEIVKACYKSLQRNILDREIIVIDDSNWSDYVSLPDYVQAKWKRRIIPHAMFSDLLRLELLINYGGSWIDATVLCTGNNYPPEYLDSDLFMFQYTRPDSDKFAGISNWFITSCSNNRLVLVLRDLLFAYWKEYDCVLDYYIFHDFFSMIVKEFPKEFASMPYGYSRKSLILLNHWNEPFDQENWDRHITNVAFHKLSARPKKATMEDKSNYYNAIIKMYS